MHHSQVYQSSLFITATSHAAGWLAQLTASPFCQPDQYASSPTVTQQSVSSTAKAETIASTHLDYLGWMASLRWLV